MSTSLPPDATDLSALTAMLGTGDVRGCCIALYEHPAVRWLLGEELHPGGAATTRRALELVRAGPEDRLLDIASGKGDSSLLAAREFGCAVTGIDYRTAAVIEATRTANVAGFHDQVAFQVADAETLPVDDAAFDIVLCECSLCLFPDKPTALKEIRRVLRPGGRVVLADVVADHDRLPECLRGPLATAACVGSALSREQLLQALESTGSRVIAAESCAEATAAMADRVYDRLRGARLLGIGRFAGSAEVFERAIEIARTARAAIAEGAIDYMIVAAAR